MQYRFQTHYHHREDGRVQADEGSVLAISKADAEDKLLRYLREHDVLWVGWATDEGKKRVERPIWVVWRKPVFEDLEWAVARTRRALEAWASREGAARDSGRTLLGIAQTHLNTVIHAMDAGEMTAFPSVPYNINHQGMLMARELISEMTEQIDLDELPMEIRSIVNRLQILF
jgi:hypothetical protein